jgi:hypothetical protein
MGAGGLLAWAERTGRRPAAQPGRGTLRFAFCGRVSTEDYQDPVTSRARQPGQAGALVAGHGQIVACFFDIGQSRVLAWARRPQAAALAAALAGPGRGWDAWCGGCSRSGFAGHSVARITRALNDAGIPCPSAADPKRNPHRTGAAWAPGTVTSILGLAGLLACGTCGRRMESAWSNGKPAYRCRRAGLMIPALAPALAHAESSACLGQRYGCCEESAGQ